MLAEDLFQLRKAGAALGAGTGLGAELFDAVQTCVDRRFDGPPADPHAGADQRAGVGRAAGHPAAEQGYPRLVGEAGFGKQPDQPVACERTLPGADEDHRREAAIAD